MIIPTSCFECEYAVDYDDETKLCGKIKSMPSFSHSHTERPPFCELKPTLSTAQAWIPVTERLPENGYWLWSATSGEVKKDFYWGGEWELAKKYGYEVLAWMPLPEPYQPDAKQ